MKTNLRRGNHAFTLIEMMTVITIIIILFGIVVGSLSYVKERQKKEKAKVEIHLLANAIEEYKMDMGEYPGDQENTPSPGSGVSRELYNALFYQGTTGTGKKVYLAELDPRTSRQGWVVSVGPTGAIPANTMIMDPWGREYYYLKGTNAQNPDFDLWSAGKDGQTNPSVPSSKVNKDDIKN